MAKSRDLTVSQYLAAQPAEARRALVRVRQILRKALPHAEEAISYKIPAWRQNGKIVIYLAGWKQHYSLYPVSERLFSTLGEVNAEYRLGPRGTIRLPLDKPVPESLIKAIAKSRLGEISGKASKPKKKQSKRRTKRS